MTATADRRLRWVATAAVSALMLFSLGYAMAGGITSVERYVAVAVGVGSFLVSGLVAWQRRPTNRTGRLLVLIGLLAALGPIRGLPWPVLSPIGIVAGGAATTVLGYLLLSFPSGELRSTASRVLVGVTAVLFIVPRLATLAATDPIALGLGYENPYLAVRDVELATRIAAAAAVIDILLLSGYVAALAARWLAASPPARRVLSPVLVPAVLVAAIRISEAAVRFGGGPPDVQAVLFTAQFAAHAAIPIGFLVGLLRVRMARGAIADLVVELGETSTPARLRDALAHALGDPTLAVAYWSATDDSYVAAGGETVALPADGSGRGVTLLERDGVPIAAIIHDPALLDDPGLVASVASAMRLAVENERLQAEVETQLAEVRASRVRIVEAGDAERQRVERNLHDGAQQRLVSMTLALRVARMKLGEDADPAVRKSLEQASDEAREALVELRELARGIHPAILTGSGLGAAVESLAGRSAVPVTIEGATGERFAPTVEGTAYFVASEALTNVNKYASATRAIIRIGRDGEHLTIEVADDGVGGAKAARGSGLSGLADRLSAIAGTLTIDSPEAGGTRLLARIPIGTPTEVPG